MYSSDKLSALEGHLKNFLKNIYRTAMSSPIEQAKTTGVNFDYLAKLWCIYLLIFYYICLEILEKYENQRYWKMVKMVVLRYEKLRVNIFNQMALDYFSF